MKPCSTPGCVLLDGHGGPHEEARLTVGANSMNVIQHPRRGVIPALRQAVCTMTPYRVQYCGQGGNVVIDYIDRADVLRVLEAIEQSHE